MRALIAVSLAEIAETPSDAVRGGEGKAAPMAALLDSAVECMRRARG